MKIGLVIYGELDTLSGGYLYDRILVEHLRAEGDTVEVVSLPSVGYGRCLGHNFSNRIYKKLLHGKFDILLQDELCHPSLIVTNRRLKGKVNYPIIGIVHHLRCSEQWSVLESFFYRILETRFLKTLDGFIFNSHTSSVAIESLLGQGKPKTIAYPGGDRLNSSVSEGAVNEKTTNENAINEKAMSPGPLRLLFVGNLISRKGLHTLIDALSNLPKTDWVLEIVGRTDVDPEYTHGVKKQAEQLGLSNNLKWSANLSIDQLKARYISSQLLVVPSQYEGFGIVYLEGKSVGLPAIACEEGAAHEIIAHGTDGFLIPPDDVDALAEAIRILIDDRERLRQMSLAGYQRFQRFPRWSQSCAQIRTFLQTCIKS